MIKVTLPSGKVKQIPQELITGIYQENENSRYTNVIFLSVGQNSIAVINVKEDAFSIIKQIQNTDSNSWKLN